MLSQKAHNIPSWDAQCERRRHHRYAVSDVVTVVDLEEAWALKREPAACATIVDVSLDGVGLSSGRAYSPGALVAVEIGPMNVIGEVRHCEAHQELYRIGIEIWAITPRSARHDLLADWSNYVWSALTNGNRVRASLKTMRIQ